MIWTKAIPAHFVTFVADWSLILGLTLTMISFRKRADSAFSPDDKVLGEKKVKINDIYDHFKRTIIYKQVKNKAVKIKAIKR